MQYDYRTLYQKNGAFLNAHPKCKRAVLLYNRYVPYFFMAAYALLWLCGIFVEDFTPRDLTAVFFIPLLALLTVSVIRFLFSRPRPYEAEGAGVEPLQPKEGTGNSFPSRHLTCAGVLAVTFFPYIPAVGALLSVLAIGLVYTRFALGWHYPSDLVAGLGLGVLIGCGIFLL